MYPTGDSIQSGNHFVACPISYEWCLSPSLLDLGSLRHSSVITFTLSTLLLRYVCYLLLIKSARSVTYILCCDISCRVEVDYAILISAEPVSSWPAPPSSQPSSSPSGRPTRQPFLSPSVPASAIPTTQSPTSPQPTLQPTTRPPQPPSIETSAPSNVCHTR